MLAKSQVNEFLHVSYATLTTKCVFGKDFSRNSTNFFQNSDIYILFVAFKLLKQLHVLSTMIYIF